MKKLNESEIEYRNNNISGPKYLLRGPYCDVGLVVIQPGEDFNTHYHQNTEEDFYTLEGKVDIYVDGEKIVISEGDIIQLPPPTKHYIKNNYDKPWKALFVKAPFHEKDKVNVDWLPEDNK